MWRTILQSVAQTQLQDLSPVLVALVIVSIEQTQIRQSEHDALRGQKALDDAMRRLGVGVDAINAQHPDAIDVKTIDTALAERVSAIVDTANVTHRAAQAMAADVKPLQGNEQMRGASPLEVKA